MQPGEECGGAESKAELSTQAAEAQKREKQQQAPQEQPQPEAQSIAAAPTAEARKRISQTLAEELVGRAAKSRSDKTPERTGYQP